MLFKKKKEEVRSIDPSNLPRHIGVIMDGNGRWAKNRHLPRSAGHKAGADTFEKIVKYCDKIGIKAITAYAFSTENWNRPKAEVDNLMELLYNYLQMAEEKFAGTNIILRVIGDRSALSEKINKAIDHAIEITNGNTGIILNMALNYGGQDEIVRAARIAAEAVKNGEMTPEEITKEFLDKNMYTGDNPPVDLIIRPSGELRLSNFLLWQSAYAELWYSDINWPDFSEKDMERAIIDYQKRNRRFGKV
ncbi:MAG: isoprenyl transferase [Clostridia bacterium]|nr:isoprenyl transferase [Clostridia bacterium]MBQ6895456.1 isoprenyl transferase [Clostridia bacterium]